MSMAEIFNILHSGRKMAQWYEASLFVLEEVGVHVQILEGLPPFFFHFFFFHCIFTLWLVSVYSHFFYH